MDKLQLRETILNQIERPAIPGREFSARQLGVVSDSGAVQTAALQSAIDFVNREGGGRLMLPAGRYRTGALRLQSGVELHLESKDTVLFFENENPALHYPVVLTHWEATPCYNYSPLLYACDAHDIAVTGEGTLDGGADENHWWNWHHQVEDAWSDDRPDLQLDDRSGLRKMNVDGTPAEQRLFGPGHFLRPNFVQLIRCERVLLGGFTLRRSPMWQLNPVMCRSITVDGVTLSSHGPNNDGCDPESCNGVHILNCRFDTGDDCISLKSGRDRDGRVAKIPCENVLIENNEFADGHGGIALGSEMSGGIRRVLAVNNRFSSPNLTYALRLKTNARRGGRVEDIILADSVMDHVHGAAVHGTMLYEDGRNGSDLPAFHNITVENIVAHGGDYGIFLEAFDEVPITGLKLRNIRIDGVDRPMRSMNWKEPVVEQVIINGKCFPRPGKVRILGVTARGKTVQASAETCGGPMQCRYEWQTSEDGMSWTYRGEGETFFIPEMTREMIRDAVDSQYVRVTAVDAQGNSETSCSYRILPKTVPLQTDHTKAEPDFPENLEHGFEHSSGHGFERQRLLCRGMLEGMEGVSEDGFINREQLAGMMTPLAKPRSPHNGNEGVDSEHTSGGDVLQIAIENGFLALDTENGFWPGGHVTRQEMATVAMQACGVNYRNASSTMPVCADAGLVGGNYGTNVARALYFGFMELEPDGRFAPQCFVTVGEAVSVLNRVADFAGI